MTDQRSKSKSGFFPFAAPQGQNDKFVGEHRGPGDSEASIFNGTVERSGAAYLLPSAAEAMYRSTFSLFTSDVPVSTNTG